MELAVAPVRRRTHAGAGSRVRGIYVVPGAYARALFLLKLGLEVMPLRLDERHSNGIAA